MIREGFKGFIMSELVSKLMSKLERRMDVLFPCFGTDNSVDSGMVATIFGVEVKTVS